MNTPWGKSDSKTTYARGVSFVGTPSHGGFAITRKVAEAHLTIPAQTRANVQGDYFFYEEDCDAYIVMLEMPYTCGDVSLDEILKSLSHWHADYLIARGYTPDLDGLKFFNEHRQSDAMRADKSSDLIITASGDWADWVPAGMVGLTTADGKRHLAPVGNYKVAHLNLLSEVAGVTEALTASETACIADGCGVKYKRTTSDD